MRRTILLTLPFLLLGAACDDAKVPNGQLIFTGGKESDTFEDVDHYTLERIDTEGKIKKLWEKTSLPTTYDMGSSGTYRFRATGYDADGKAVVRGETLEQDVASMIAADVPIFLSRTDRMTIAEGNFAVTPGEYPKVGHVGTAALWLWANPSSDDIKTDGYNYAYWQQIKPIGTSVDFSTISCPTTPCEWKTLVVTGGYVAIAISDEWAIWVDEYRELSGDYELPASLDSFADVAGGRVLSGAKGTAFLVGGARTGEPTAYNLSFASTGLSSVTRLSTPRAGAATLFEVGSGLVVVGGSATGAGVERIPPEKTEFVALDYPPDPVTGAALVREDATHVLRVGGKNLDGSPAETVRIDLSCTGETCVVTPLPDLSLAITAARSFYDAESNDSILVGEDDAGKMVVFRYDSESAAIVPIDIPANQARVHATAIELPHRKVALVGGSDPAKPTSSRSVISVVSF